MGEEKKENRNWGGDRPGSGRPRATNPRVPMSVQIPQALKDEIQAEAKELGISMSQAAERRLKRKRRDRDSQKPPTFERRESTDVPKTHNLES